VARSINIRVSDKAEQFINEMARRGLNERDVIAKAVGLLRIAVETGRVALVNPYGEIEYYFSLDVYQDVTPSVPVAGIAYREEPVEYPSPEMPRGRRPRTDRPENGGPSDPHPEEND
jgi:hypothetical protein